MALSIALVWGKTKSEEANFFVGPLKLHFAFQAFGQVRSGGTHRGGADRLDDRVGSRNSWPGSYLFFVVVLCFCLLLFFVQRFLNFSHFWGLDSFCGKQEVWLLCLAHELRN